MNTSIEKRGTPKGLKRNYKNYRYELIYVNEKKEIIHKKYRSSTELIQDDSNPITSCPLLHYYVRVKPNKTKLGANKHMIKIFRINEPISQPV